MWHASIIFHNWRILQVNSHNWRISQVRSHNWRISHASSDNWRISQVRSHNYQNSQVTSHNLRNSHVRTPNWQNSHVSSRNWQISHDKTSSTCCLNTKHMRKFRQAGRVYNAWRKKNSLREVSSIRLHFVLVYVKRVASYICLMKFFSYVMLRYVEFIYRR